MIVSPRCRPMKRPSIIPTMNPDLVFLGGCSDFMTPGFLNVAIARFRSRDIPILLFQEQNARQKLAFPEETVGDCLPWPFDQEEVARRTELLLRVKRRLDQLRAQAVVDELTGVYNCRFLGGQLKVRLGEARRSLPCCRPTRTVQGRQFWRKGCGSPQPDTPTRTAGKVNGYDQSRGCIVSTGRSRFNGGTDRRCGFASLQSQGFGAQSLGVSTRCVNKTRPGGHRIPPESARCLLFRFQFAGRFEDAVDQAEILRLIRRQEIVPLGNFLDPLQ